MAENLRKPQSLVPRKLRSIRYLSNLTDIDDVQVGNYTSEVHGNNVEFNLTLVPKDVSVQYR